MSDQKQAEGLQKAPWAPIGSIKWTEGGVGKEESARSKEKACKTLDGSQFAGLAACFWLNLPPVLYAS